MVASKRAASSSDDEISDEQIEQLLARATARLQEKSKDSELTQKSTAQHNFHFPRLDAGELKKPYVSTKGDVATLDASRLLQEKQRKQANGIKKVEDPVASKAAAAEVRCHISRLRLLTMRKIIPIFILSRVRAPFWLPFCTTESFTLS